MKRAFHQPKVLTFVLDIRSDTGYVVGIGSIVADSWVLGFARRNLQKNKSSKIYDQAILSYNLSNYTDMSDSIGSVQQ